MDGTNEYDRLNMELQRVDNKLGTITAQHNLDAKLAKEAHKHLKEEYQLMARYNALLHEELKTAYGVHSDVAMNKGLYGDEQKLHSYSPNILEVAMNKRLYGDKHKLHSLSPNIVEVASEEGGTKSDALGWSELILTYEQKLHDTTELLIAVEKIRADERMEQDDDIKQLQRDLADSETKLRKERQTTLDHAKRSRDAMTQAEEFQKKWSDALCAISSAETRASVAEARLTDLENTKAMVEMCTAKKELQTLNDKMRAIEDHAKRTDLERIGAFNEIAAMRGEIISLQEALEANIQELSKKSDEFAMLEKKDSELLKFAEALKSEKAKWEVKEKNYKEFSQLDKKQIAAMEAKISTLQAELETTETFAIIKTLYDELQREVNEKKHDDQQLLLKIKADATELLKLIKKLKRLTSSSRR